MNTTPRLGDAEMDDDHQRLESLILDLLHAPAEGRAQALDALRVHAARHFAVEDDSLRAMADGNSQCHLDEHAAVLRSLDDVYDLLVREQGEPASRQALVDRLATQLLGWLPEHVREMDAGVATHRVRSRFGGAPISFHRPAKPGA
jgi:hemerythrin